MSEYCVGKIIKEFRERKHLLQSQLCEGLCEPSTLSKIESCRQNPNKKLFEALMNRLGVPVGIFNVPVTEGEYKRGKIERIIIDKFFCSDYEIEVLLEKYKKCGQKMDKLEKQFYLCAGAFFSRGHGKSDEQTLLQLIEAMQQTFPGYTAETDISSHLLTVFELLILISIATSLHNSGKYCQALHLLTSVKIYLENSDIERDEYGKLYPPAAYNLSNWLFIDGKYMQALEAAERGIKCCIMYGRLSFFPDLIYRKGSALVSMGRKTEGRQCMMQAVTIFAAMNAENRIAELKKDASEYFGSNFLLTYE
jgi:transcriptional regulator with XRE-family HTH domain